MIWNRHWHRHIYLFENKVILATDLVFRDPASLRRLYPRLIHHGLTSFGSRQVLRFLGRTVPPAGGVPKRFPGEVISDLQERPEGLRLKHQVNQNSVKLDPNFFLAREDFTAIEGGMSQTRLRGL